MDDKRQFRKAGDMLLLGQILYRLESVEGCGGSAVVYRASYEDALNQGSRHYVFIKELFPYHPKGNIYRNPSGELCCKEDGVEIMEQCRQHFYQGNQANLKLLEQAPEYVSGNLNAYAAYGTYYSVLTVHGGECLETFLEEGRAFGTLRETAEIILKLLEAVEVFHNSKMLHLDISPDNILLLPVPLQESREAPRQRFRQALLIDYNSVWEMNQEKDREYCFSEKEGYTAPEIYLRQYADIGAAADLYSVCAVWFRMLTGTRLSDKEIIGNRLRKSLHQDLEIFQDQPKTAVGKTVQIMVKGLHVLARRRYQSAAQMREDVEELLLRMDNKGISHSAFWEISRQAWESSRRENEYPCSVHKGNTSAGQNAENIEAGQEKTQYFKRRYATPEGVEYKQEQLTAQLQNGGGVLLTGAGGIGKSSLLLRLWEESVQRYQPTMPVVIYIPLIGYQQAKDEAYFIRKYLLRHMGVQGQADSLESTMQELERQLDLPDSWKLILLLDGLNEAGGKKKLLIKEILYLASKPAIKIIITDRSDCIKKYGLYQFQVVELLPLTRTEVLQALEQDIENRQNRCIKESETKESEAKEFETKESETKESEIKESEAKESETKESEAKESEAKESEIKESDIELLRNPMMLSLYRKTLEMSYQSAKEWNQQKLMEAYLDSLCMRQQHIESGNPISQLRIQYLIYHFLPEIAAEMKCRRKTLLNIKELYSLAQRTYKVLGSKAFAMAFPEYLGKSRQMLAGICDAMEWLDYAVEEQFIGQMHLLRKNGERNYCLVHDNFMEYLAGQAVKNRRKTAKYQRKTKIKNICLFLAALSVLSTGGFYMHKAAAPHSFSDQQRLQIRELLYQIGRNLGTLGAQLENQQQILEKAAKKEVLEGDAEALKAFLEWMEYKQQQTAQYHFERSKNKQTLENLEKTGAELPFRILEGLLDKTYEMDIFMEESLAHLAEGLGKTTLSYTDREELTAFYQAYLDIYTETTYREMVMVLVCLEEDMEGEMLDIIGQITAFRDNIRTYPYEGKSTKVLEAELQSAKAKLRECRNRMKTRNYQISLPEWQ